MSWQADGKNWRLELNKFLLAYRSTSHATTGVTPVERFFKRRLTTKLPEFTELGENQGSRFSEETASKLLR